MTKPYLADAVPLQEVKRALVIKLRHHGDVLLTSPLIQALKNHAPHIEIDALVYADTAPMISEHPALSELYCVDRKWKELGFFRSLPHEWRLMQRLRQRDYELVIHLTDHPRGAWLGKWLGAKWRVAPTRNRNKKTWKKAFTHLVPAPLNTPRHTVEKHLDALRRIGLQPTERDKPLVLSAGEDAQRKIDALLQQHRLHAKHYIHLHPTSRWLFKCWPEESFANLIDMLAQKGHTLVLTAAPDAREMEMTQRILQSVTQGEKVINLAGQLSLKEMAALSRNAQLFIGVDSAPMHIAAAMQTPVVALFGPSGDQEWGPWHVPNKVITSDIHPCRPCGLDGCGGGKVSECLTSLPVVRVFDAAMGLVGTHNAIRPV